MTYDEITYPEVAIILISIIIAAGLVWVALLVWERAGAWRLPRIFKRGPSKEALMCELRAEREKSRQLTLENKILLAENRRLRGM